MRRITIGLLVVWAGLMFLLAATLAASFLVSGAASAATGVAIALIKAFLVFWFFMRLRSEGGLIRLAAMGGGVWLLLLGGLASADYLAR